MPEPERSIEELVEAVVREAFRSGRQAPLLGGDDETAEYRAARATLLRAVARLRKENERLAVLAAMQLCELGKVPDPRGTAWPVMTVEQARQVLADYAAPAPKGGDRE